MRKFSIAISVLAVCAACAQDGWKSPKTVAATVVERYAEQPERKVEVTQSEGAVSYKTSAAIDGELGGVPRIEVVGSKGIFTWIEGKPEVALQLFSPTTPDAMEFLEKPRFSRADLEFNLQGIEKALGKKVLVGKAEAVAGRNCLTLRVPDKADSPNTDYQKLWVDRETGLTMKQQDFFAGKMTYAREITTIAFNTGGAASSEPAAGTKVLRGLVSPLALVKIGQLAGTQQFKSDIAKINAKTAWAGAFDISSSLGYAVTSSREIHNNNGVLLGNPNNQRNQSGGQGQNGRQNRRQNAFGQRARFMSTEGSVIEMTLSDDNAQALVPATRAIRIERDASGNTRVIEMPAGEAVGSSQTTSSAGGGGGANGSGTSGSASKTAKSFPFAQSDFIDPANGDTLSLLQVSGRSIDLSLGDLVLGAATEIKNKGLESAKAYSVAIPARLTVLTWKKGQVSYALVSTNLSAERLADLATKVKTP